MAALKKKVTARKSVKQISAVKKAPKKTTSEKKTAKKASNTMEISRKTSRQVSSKQAAPKAAPKKKPFNPIRKPDSQKILTAEGWKRLMMGAKK